ncbi:recombination protein NinB [Gellertiella hungarica]|uniref:Recombination protein NinB n=1 Tax=Gellertiella hungarica TaxID=1572859 RepID=A0A7W6NJL9_9HYPH|nr:recombination protein NinB [Gellertiella hungarica]MBB4063639.1 hypothetical protein [Gellertiella hungarica]
MDRALFVLNSHEDKAAAIRIIQGASKGCRVEIKATKRSLPQNDLMWALLTEVSRQLDHAGRKYEPAEWKAIFLHAFGREITFLPSLDKKTFLPIELSSSDLSKDEMTEFLEFIIKEGTERGVVFNLNADTKTDESEPCTSSGEAEDPPPSSASNLTSSDRIHLVDLARKGLSTAREKSLPPGDRLALVGQMSANLVSHLSRAAEGQLKSAVAAIRAVINEQRTEEQAIAWFAEVLDCSPEHLKPRSAQ